MIIERPYNSEENEVNKVQVNMIENWAKVNKEEIAILKIYGAAVNAITLSGRNITVNVSERRNGYKKMSEYMYMKERINGKYVRIKG